VNVISCLRILPGAAAVLCVLSTTAFAQDSAQSEIDLGALLDIPVSTAAKNAQNLRQVAGSVTLLSGLALGFRIENVFNTRYANAGSIEHSESSIVQNGRTLVVRLTSRF
jgi:hypothetical protein